MAVIQSGASATQWTIDITSDAGRVTFYDTNGNPMSNVSSLGNILNALNANVTIILGGQSTGGFTVTGTTGSLTLSFEATIDGTNWFAVAATPIPSAAPVTSTTANGQWVVDLAGFYGVRGRISAFTSGSMTVSVVVTPQNSKTIAQNVSIAGTLPISGEVISDGYVTTAAPSYTNNTAEPLSLTTAGALRVDGSAVTQPVSIAGTLPVSIVDEVGVVDLTNSSTTPLGGSATFTGTGIDVSGYASVGVCVFANQAGTLNMEFSTDNTNWDASIPYTVLASDFVRVTTGAQAKFFRVRYVNGGAAQATFRLQTILKPVASYPSTVPVDTVIGQGDDAIITKSIITGKTTAGGGAYVDVKVNPSGTMVVDASGSTGVAVTGTVSATQSGTWTVQPGNTPNTSPWLTTISQGGNAATVSGAGALKVDGSAVTQPVSGTVTSNQGTAAALSGYWPVRVTDGTNTMPTADVVTRAQFHKVTDGTNTATVTAASTAPIASDPALVVTISPNSPPNATNTGVVSSVNSSTATLGGAGVFTGTGESSLNYEAVTVSVMAIGASAPPGTLSVQQSSDGTNWDIQDSFSVAGGTASPTGSFDIIVPLVASNFRIVYTNGATAQTSFRLQSVKWPIKVSLPNATQKGIQPQVFTATQDCKDSGRVIKVFSAVAHAVATTEGMITLTPLTDFVAGGTGTSFTISAGKRLRIVSFNASIRTTANTICGGMAKLRISSFGAVTTATTLAVSIGTGSTAAATASAAGGAAPIPDGIELTGTMQLGVSAIGSLNTALWDISVIGYEY
jgi:hypothetical protein